MFSPRRAAVCSRWASGTKATTGSGNGSKRNERVSRALLKIETLAERLAGVESRNLAAPAGTICWFRAQGATVEDTAGRSYVDLTSAFGAATIGHSHPYLIDVLHQQAQTLIAGLGDVHPNEPKAALLEALVAKYPGGARAKGVLGLSGSDAVEIAMKTARLATGRPGVLALEGAYHGLSFGSLAATHERRFSERFLCEERRARFVPFPGPDGTVSAEEALACAERELRGGRIGLVLVEPIQGRGGIRVPPPGFLSSLAALAREHGALFAVDEVYTGMGRTGKFLAVEWEDGLVPDLVCLGKGLGGGLPVSACLARAEVMDAWPPFDGEAIHTQTFLGWPLGCAAALAALEVVVGDGLVERANEIGRFIEESFADLLADEPRVRLRGRGALWGLVLPESAEAVCREAAEAGVLVLTEGPRRDVVAIVPPLTIEEGLLRGALAEIARGVRRAAAPGGRAAPPGGCAAPPGGRAAPPGGCAASRWD